MGRELGKRTAPGFGDPRTATSMSQAAGASAPAAQTEQAGDPQNGDRPCSPPSGVALAPALVSMPAGPGQALGEGLPREPPRARHPMVDVEVRYEHGPAPQRELPERRVLEVWTQNSIYALDARMHCLEVRSPATGQTIADHPFVGTRLVGGQWQSEAGVELSYPLPRPGSCAVFEGQRGNKRRFSRTSAVERVVLRLQVVSVTDTGCLPSWAELIEE